MALFARNFGTGFALTGSGIRKPCKKSSIEIVFFEIFGNQAMSGGYLDLYIQGRSKQSNNVWVKGPFSNYVSANLT